MSIDRWRWSKLISSITILMQEKLIQQEPHMTTTLALLLLMTTSLEKQLKQLKNIQQLLNQVNVF